MNEHVCGSIVVMKADYRLERNGEIRKGVDLLTLAFAEGGWKTINQTCEQSGHALK